MRRVLPGVVAALALVALSPGAASAAVSWRFEPVPLPAGAVHGLMGSVSCGSADDCTALGGTYVTLGERFTPLVEHWDGASWTAGSAVSPPGAGFYSLYQVSCPAADNCTAVGSSETASGFDSALAEHWDGTSWTIQPTPDAPGYDNSVLISVSCPSPDSCTAVGDSLTQTVGGHQVLEQALAEHWDGTSWTIQPTPHAQRIAGSLAGVSCFSASRCTAVGATYRGTQLIERWNGSKWILQPPPPGSGGLGRVACPSAFRCIAVGSQAALGTGSGLAPLAAQWDGTSWAIQPTPTLRFGGQLSGLSCPSPDNCTAVGMTAMIGSSGKQIPVPLAEHWNGTSWTVQATASPQARKLLTAISCVSAVTCTAVGYTVKLYETPEQPAAEHK